jgi:hypothetical protein
MAGLGIGSIYQLAMFIKAAVITLQSKKQQSDTAVQSPPGQFTKPT